MSIEPKRQFSPIRYASKVRII